MAKKITGLLTFISIISLGTSLALAQGTTSSQAVKPTYQVNGMEIIASVNVSDVELEKGSTPGSYIASFTLVNGVGVQPDIRYGIMLDAKIGGVIIKGNETVVLGQGEQAKRTLPFILPAYMTGNDIEVTVYAETSKGLPLGSMSLGRITGNATYNGLNIKACTLTVSGDSKTYTANHGVDITSKENLTITCPVENLSDSSQTIKTVQFQPHLRTVLNSPFSPITVPLVQPLSLLKGETKNISFIATSALRPDRKQAYTATVQVVDAQKRVLSNPQYVKYVEVGDSATIQVAQLDNVVYTKGSTARVFVTTTEAASNFPDARTSPIERDLVAKAVLSSSGKECGAGQVIIPAKTSFSKQTILVPITLDCPYPEVKVSLSSKEGVLFDGVAFKTAGKLFDPNYTKQATPLGELPKAPGFDQKSTSPYGKWLAIAVLILGAIALTYKGYTKFGKKARSVTVGLFVLFSLFSTTQVHADTIIFSVGRTEDVVDYSGDFGGTVTGTKFQEYYKITATVNMTKTKYNVGENITAALHLKTSWSVCTNYCDCVIKTRTNVYGDVLNEAKTATVAGDINALLSTMDTGHLIMNKVDNFFAKAFNVETAYAAPSCSLSAFTNALTCTEYLSLGVANAGMAGSNVYGRMKFVSAGIGDGNLLGTTGSYPPTALATRVAITAPGIELNAINTADKPTVTLSTNRAGDAIPGGEDSVTVTWTSSNVGSCIGIQGTGGNIAANGSMAVTQTGDTQYWIKCQNPGATAYTPVVTKVVTGGSVPPSCYDYETSFQCSSNALGIGDYCSWVGGPGGYCEPCGQSTMCP